MSEDRTIVRCKNCGRQKDVSIADCISTGWPECCGSTMILNPTEPRKFEKAMDKVLAPAVNLLKKARGQ